MVKKIISYKFLPNLVEGIIVKRIRSYIMLVKYKNEIIKCHCPTTCSIGNFSLQNLPCLLSISDDPKRKTKYTVEAISLDNQKIKNKKWIGINQTKANKYFEHFLKQGTFDKIFPNINKIEREKIFNNSKFDFKIDNTFLEIKTPLQIIKTDIPKYIKLKKEIKFSSGKRFLKHVVDLKNYLKLKKRAILIFLYMYDINLRNIYFTENDKKQYDKNAEKIVDEFKETEKLGLETWVVKLKINKKELNFIEVKKIDI